MSKFPTQDKVIDAIFLGIQTARENFFSWTGEELYLSYAPKNFLNIHISQELSKIKNPPAIFIDATILDILKSSLQNQKKETVVEFMKTNDISQGTISITLDEKNSDIDQIDAVSRVVTVVKNGVRNNKEEYLKDIETLCKMLSQKSKDDSTLDYGVFAFYLDISNTARIKAQKRVEEIVNSFDKVVAAYSDLQSNFKGGDIKEIENIGQWCVGSYIIEPK